MKMRFCGVVALSGVLALSGCASISPEECARMDWYALGVEDGRQGRSEQRIADHREACAEVGVVPDREAWARGRGEGLQTYCELPNAIRAGKQRDGYEGVCADSRFGELYRAARKVGDAEGRIDTIDNNISWRESELSTDKKMSDDKRHRLRSEIRDLDRQRMRARDDRDDAEHALDRLRRDLGV